MIAMDECRKKFEAQCKFMGVGWGLDWDESGFYVQLEADRAYTWFELGFNQAKTTETREVDTVAEVDLPVRV